MIARCSCSSPMQDEIHGKGNRLFNERTNGKAPRCTVCGKDLGGGTSAPKKGK